MARDSVRIEGLDDVLRRLKALGPEASKRGGPVRAAVRKASVVIQKEAQENIRRFVSEPNTGGWPDESTGLMEKSVKPLRAKAPQKYKGETFFVTIPRKVRYPVTDRTPSGINVSQVARMHEYGLEYTPKSGPLAGRTVKLKRQSWMGSAFHAKKDEAVTVMTDEIVKGIARLERKLAKS